MLVSPLLREPRRRPGRLACGGRIPIEQPGFVSKVACGEETEVYLGHPCRQPARVEPGRGVLLAPLLVGSGRSQRRRPPPAGPAGENICHHLLNNTLHYNQVQSARGSVYLPPFLFFPRFLTIHRQNLFFSLFHFNAVHDHKEVCKYPSNLFLYTILAYLRRVLTITPMTSDKSS